MNALTLQLTDSTKLTDEQFYETVALLIEDIKIERTANGELILIATHRWRNGETKTLAS